MHSAYIRFVRNQIPANVHGLVVAPFFFQFNPHGVLTTSNSCTIGSDEKSRSHIKRPTWHYIGLTPVQPRLSSARIHYHRLAVLELEGGESDESVRGATSALVSAVDEYCDEDASLKPDQIDFVFEEIRNRLKETSAETILDSDTKESLEEDWKNFDDDTYPSIRFL